MKRSLVTAVFGFVVLALLVASMPERATAAQLNNALPSTGFAAATKAVRPGTSKKGGVTISPAFQQISLSADQSSQTFDFTVTNNSSEAYEFALSVVDFGSLDDTGGVLFAGNAEKQLSYRYALSPWVTLEKDRVVVAARATEKIPITIVNKESLTPGGHYGAVLVTPTDTGSGSDRKVQIDQVASSLLFVKKLGGEVYKLDLKSADVRTHFFGLPGSVEMRFQNSGNVHVIPRGLTVLTDPRGHVVKRGVINADSGILLPESFRHVSVPLEAVGKAWMPGRYTLTTTYRYDDVTATRSVKTSFVYLNILSIVLLVLVLSLLLVLCVSRTVRRGIKMSVLRAGTGLMKLLRRPNRKPIRK